MTVGSLAAATSFRDATGILFVVVIGLRVGQFWSYRTAAISFLVSGLLGVVLAMLEVADPAWYLGLINATDFTNLKVSGLVTDRYLYGVQGVINSQTSVWFNTPLLEPSQSSFRFGGPNMHGISYSYLLSVAQLILFSLGRYGLVLALLALNLTAGVKGAMILLVMSLVLFLVWRLIRSKRILLLISGLYSIIYVVYGVQTGLKTGDFHSLGFMGGVNGFLANPLGHELGVGGNLSQPVNIAFWQNAQHAGATDVGMESAVGVLLYQMGIGTLAVFASLVALICKAPFWTMPQGKAAPTDLLFVGLWVGLLNGVFQEEAYSPYAVGLLVLFCSIAVANGRRSKFLGA